MCHITGSGADEVDENETSRADTLDLASTLDSHINGSVANGTITTPKWQVGKTNECSNEENPPQLEQNNLGFQQVPDECSVLNNHFPVDNSSEHAQSPILQNTTVPKTCSDKFAALQQKSNLAPLHVECDPVSSSLSKMYHFDSKFI